MTLIYLIYLLQLTILNERLSQGPAVLSSVDVFIHFVRELFLYFCYQKSPGPPPGPVTTVVGKGSKHIPNLTISALNFAIKNQSTSIFFDPTKLISMPSFVLDGF